MKTIGFFGGTFDPLHIGHLHLAVQIFERCGLDEVLFCPAFCSPFKTDRPPRASAAARLAMLERVLAEIPHFHVTPIEIERGGPSFTVETLRTLTKRKDARYRLVLADDVASHFHSWKEPEEILHLSAPIVGTRGTPKPLPSSPVKDQLEKARISIATFDVSSTEVRERLKKKLYCGHLVPGKALDYIHAHDLY